MNIWVDGSGTYYCVYPENSHPHIYPNPAGITHNESEWRAIELALRYAHLFPNEQVKVFSDSFLAVSQLIGGYRALDPKMQVCMRRCQTVLRRYWGSDRVDNDNFNPTHLPFVLWMPREVNLAGQALEAWLKQRKKESKRK